MRYTAMSVTRMPSGRIIRRGCLGQRNLETFARLSSLTYARTLSPCMHDRLERYLTDPQDMS